MSKLLSIPIISAYLYGVTILTQYGFNSYFGIPSSYLESSITQNFVYFFQLFQLASAVAGAMKWWMWLVIILGALTILFIYASHFIWQKIISFVAILLLCLMLYGSYNFGTLLGQSTPEFYVPVAGCVSLDQNTKYIIPSFYQGKAILVSITESNTLAGSVLLKDLSELGCATEHKTVGLIKQ